MSQVKYKKTSIIRRLVADMLDFFLAMILFFAIYAFAIQPIFYNRTNYKELAISYYQRLEDTGLYTFDEKTMYCNIVTFEVDEDTELTAEKYYSFYDYKLVDYYTDGGKIEVFNDLKTQSNLFEEVDGNFNLKSDASVNAVRDFYVQSISKAIDEIFLSDENNLKDLNELNKYTILMSLSSAGISFIIIYFAFPLLFDKGQTIGKKAMNLRVASLNKGVGINYLAFIFRQLLIVVVGILGALFTAGLTALAFAFSPLFNKDCRSLADLASNTIVYQNVIVDENEEFVVLKQESKEKDSEENK